MHRARALGLSSALTLTMAAAASRAATLEVGPDKPYAKPCDAIAAAAAGDTIEVDAAGDYDGDTCTWSTDGLTVRGVNGRAKIDDTGVAVSGQKGIFVILAANATIENFELSGAAIDGGSNPGDDNGAGIRHQGLNLTVRGCVFHDDQDGILGGPLDAQGNDASGQGTVLIEDSEFYANGVDDGQTHNIYLGHYAKFTLQGSYSHGAKGGHLVKSRALETHVLYNLLADGESPDVGYEVNLPNGGVAYVIGNVMIQNADPAGVENGAIVDFGSEGPMTPSDLFVVANTIVNERTMGATFVQVDAAVTTPAVVRDNILNGGGTVCNQGSAVLDHNYTDATPMFVDAAHGDYHLRMGSPCVDAGVDPGTGDGQSLAPTEEYVATATTAGRHTVGVIDVGAYELGGEGGSGGGGGGDGGGGVTGTTNTTGAGPSTGPGMTAGPSAGSGGTGGAAAASDSSGGCGCRVDGGDAPGRASSGVVLGLAALLAARRRRGR